VVGGGSCLVIGDGWIGAARQEQVDGPLVAVLSGRHQRREAARLGFVGTRPCIQEQLQASEAGFRLRAGRRRVQRLIVERISGARRDFRSGLKEKSRRCRVAEEGRQMEGGEAVRRPCLNQ
jgi:hypothetical protein